MFFFFSFLWEASLFWEGGGQGSAGFFFSRSYHGGVDNLVYASLREATVDSHGGVDNLVYASLRGAAVNSTYGTQQKPTRYIFTYFFIDNTLSYYLLVPRDSGHSFLVPV